MKKNKNHEFKYCQYSATIRLMPENYMIASKEKGHWICDTDAAIEDDDAAEIYVIIRNCKFDKTDKIVNKLNAWLEGTGDKAIYKLLGQYLSDDEESYPAIIQALRIALKEKPDSFIDYVEYTETDGINIDMINVWDKVKLEFTVREFCDLVGITN